MYVYVWEVSNNAEHYLVTFPQFRQWCLRRTKLNAAWQPVHWETCSSGTQGGASGEWQQRSMLQTLEVAGSKRNKLSQQVEYASKIWQSDRHADKRTL